MPGKKSKANSTSPFLTSRTEKQVVSVRPRQASTSLAVGTAPDSRRTPAKKRRPRAVETKSASRPRSTDVTQEQVATPVRMMLRPRTMEDDAFIQTVTTDEIAPIFRATYGYDLDLPMVMNYIQASNTRMILVDDKVAGYVSYVADDSGKLNIGSLILASEHQGKGYGTRIMRQIEQEARAMGIYELEVFIQQTNARSQAFAESLGFTRVPSMQPQTIVMVKSLQPLGIAGPPGAPMTQPGFPGQQGSPQGQAGLQPGPAGPQNPGRPGL
ncbi:MAG: GNAT family N-acetyltransferase [Firmicutes bacterium]|nr:GNAT family N-acetyltransferase [Bacillota bacterium]